MGDWICTYESISVSHAVVISTDQSLSYHDSMVNNAGVSPEADNQVPIHETTEERYDFTMKINARGVFLGCKYAAIQFLKQEPIPGKDRGWIVNISSALAIMGIWGSPCYSASKGAVWSLNRAVAVDLAPFHIHSNAILPGCEFFESSPT